MAIAALGKLVFKCGISLLINVFLQRVVVVSTS